MTSEPRAREKPASIPGASPTSSPRPIRVAAEAHATAGALASDLAKTAAVRERELRLPTAEIQQLKELNLVNLLIPKAWGGVGGDLVDAANVVFELSKGDASIGMLLAFHYKHALIPMSLDFEREGESILRQSAERNWFWGNITGTWDLTATPLEGGRYRISGTKKMCTGAGVSDVVAISARRGDIERNQQVHFVVDARHERLKNHHDWGDYPGMKLTATDSYTVDDLEVGGEAVIPRVGKPLETFPPFYTEYGTVLYAAILLGSAFGALEGAANYTRTLSGARMWAGVTSPTQDALTLQQYGDFWIKLQAVHALFERTAREVLAAWDRRRELPPEALLELAVRGHALRVSAAEAGLDVSSRIFGVTGARSLSAKYGLDRHWRDIRMLTTHEPLMYWVRNIGDYYLNGNFTRVQFNTAAPT
jgi:alkylation response protein AidB-like acyl-CoA dehydrogenase